MAPAPKRRVIVLITASENGQISVDARGPYSGREGLLTLLDEAKKLIEQGNFGTERSRPGGIVPPPR